MIVLKKQQNIVLAQKPGDKKWKPGDKKWKPGDREITIEIERVDRYELISTKKPST